MDDDNAKPIQGEEASVSALPSENQAGEVIPAKSEPVPAAGDDFELHLARQGFLIGWLLVPVGFSVQLGPVAGGGFLVAMIITFLLPVLWVAGSLIYLFCTWKSRWPGTKIFFLINVVLSYVCSAFSWMAFMMMQEAHVIHGLQDGDIGLVLWSLVLGGLLPAGILTFFVVRLIEKPKAQPPLG